MAPSTRRSLAQSFPVNEGNSRLKLVTNKNSVNQWQVSDAEARTLVSDGVSVAFLLDFANEALPKATPTAKEAAPAESVAETPAPTTSTAGVTVAASVLDVREYCRQQLAAAKDVAKTKKETAKAGKGSAVETSADASAKQNTTLTHGSTRHVSYEVKRRTESDPKPYTSVVKGDIHFLTGTPLCGPAKTWVTHHWDENYKALAQALERDAKGDLDKKFFVDVFSTDLHVEDCVALAKAGICRSSDVLLVLDPQGKALGQLWVIFECLLATEMEKLRVCCSSSAGFGSSEESVRAWEARIDAVDWVQARATRRGDEKRLRRFAEKFWDQGRGMDVMLAKLTKCLRREIYSEILVAAAREGNITGVSAALSAGADPQRKDAYGSTGEILAAYAGHSDIENLLFAERMKHVVHLDFEQYFNPERCPVTVPENVDLSFVTEPGGMLQGENFQDVIRSAMRSQESGTSTKTPDSNHAAADDSDDEAFFASLQTGQ